MDCVGSYKVSSMILQKSVRICLLMIHLHLFVDGEIEEYIFIKQASAVVKVGVLLPWDGDWVLGPAIAGGLLVALDRIKYEGLLHVDMHGVSVDLNVNVSWSWQDTNCNGKTGVAAALSLYPVHVFVGGGCSSVCEPVALLCAALEIPFISFGCSSAPLSDKGLYPTFSRLVGTWLSVGPMFRLFLERMDWYRVAIVTSAEHIYTDTGLEIRKALQQADMTVFLHRVDYVYDGQSIVEKNLVSMMKTEAHIVILLLKDDELAEVMLGLQSLKLLKHNAFISIDINKDQYLTIPDTGNSIKRMMVRTAYEGLISARVRKPSGPVWDKFAQKVVEKLKDPIFQNEDNPVIDDPKEVDVHAGLLYDAFLLWATSLNNGLHELPEEYSIHIPKAILTYLRNVSFEGMSGHVELDKNGDRQLDYTISMVQLGQYVPLYDYNYADKQLVSLGDKLSTTDVLWPGMQNWKPTDTPICGWNNQFCIEVTRVCIILICAGVVLWIFIASFGCYKMWKYLMFALDLKFTSLREIKRDTIEVKLEEESDTHVIKYPKIQNPTPKLMYKGRRVFIKEMKCQRQIDLDDPNIQLDLKHMRDLKHSHLNEFIGVCCEPPNACIIMLHCKKGCLQDVLLNHPFELSWDWRLWFAMDIAAGMLFLHNSPIGSHGSLTSRNVVVDNKWVCMLTDYGLPRFRSDESCSLLRTRSEEEDAEKLLWTAPELLRMTERPVIGTQKGDVYSFGIITQELVTMTKPYALERQYQSPEDILQRVIGREEPAFRPSVPEDICNTDWMALMRVCWIENPMKRSTFKIIYKFINDCTDEGRHGETETEKGLRLLAEDTDHLEENINALSVCIHDIRTRNDRMALAAQQFNTNLPKCVAERLMGGHCIEAEYYDSVTVYMSDVINFNSILYSSTPPQIVTFLNELYGCFEKVEAKFDLFKVEALGDTYMVASGLPLRNGHRHAGEMARFAMEIHKEISNFQVPDLDQRSVFMRVSIHTGPCIGAAVGCDTLRYRLYGDLLNISSKLLAYGMPQRIHTSEATKQILDEIGGFCLKFNIEMKIPGNTTKTYWLSDQGSILTEAHDLCVNSTNDWIVPTRPHSGVRPRSPIPRRRATVD